MTLHKKIVYPIVAFASIILIAAIGIIVSHYTTSNYEIPKPLAYFRIEPYDSNYVKFDKLPISIEINAQAKAFLSTDSTTKNGDEWLNITYPRFNATVYCSYVAITHSTLNVHIKNMMERVMRNARMEIPRNAIFVDTINGSTSQVFFTSAESITPLQFITTDSISYLFTGAVYFNDKVKEDSIAPVVDCITDDVMHMLQNIKVKK